MSAANVGKADPSSLPTTISETLNGILEVKIDDKQTGYLWAKLSPKSKKSLLAAFEKHLPEKKEQAYATFNMTEAEVALYDGEIFGWNDCIDHITQLIKEASNDN